MKILPLHQTFVRTVAFFTAVLLTHVASAAPLSVGDSFPVLDGMQDQHEAAYPMPEGTRHVAVAFSMGAGKAANRYSSEQGAAYLPAEEAVFIANIYGMPGIGRLFAMPKMKKYPHRIMIADEEGLLDDFPQEDGRVTIFDLDAAGKITAIRYWGSKSEESPF